MKRYVPVVIAAFLLLSACTDPAGAGSAAAPAEPTAQAPAPPPADAQADPEASESATSAVTAEPTDPQPDPDAGDVSGCIVGVWELKNDTFESALANMPDMPPGFSIEGDLAVEFTAGGEHTLYKDAFTLVMEAEGQMVRSVTTGAWRSSYVVEDGVIHLFDGIDLYHESYMEMPGIGRVDIGTAQDAEYDLFGYQGTAPSDADFGVYDGAAKFSCIDSGLTIEVEGASVNLVRGTVPDMTGWQ